RQRANTNAARHCSWNCVTTLPSTLTTPSRICKSIAGLLASRRASQPAQSTTRPAQGQAATGGRSETATASAANNPSITSNPNSQCAGRHSSRQIADALDQDGQLFLGRGLVAHEPVPKLIVFAVPQP